MHGTVTRTNGPVGAPHRPDRATPRCSLDFGRFECSVQRGGLPRRAFVYRQAVERGFGWTSAGHGSVPDHHSWHVSERAVVVPLHLAWQRIPRGDGTWSPLHGALFGGRWQLCSWLFWKTAPSPFARRMSGGGSSWCDRGKGPRDVCFWPDRCQHATCFGGVQWCESRRWWGFATGPQHGVGHPCQAIGRLCLVRERGGDRGRAPSSQAALCRSCFGGQLDAPSPAWSSLSMCLVRRRV